MLFISYSHKDQEFFGEIQKFLGPWEGELDVWTDQRIRAGQEWEREIRQAIGDASLALLLISPNFLNSKYIRDDELPLLFEAWSTGRLIVTALYLRHCEAGDYRVEAHGRSMALTELQGLNSPNDPIADYKGHDRDAHYKKAVRQLKELYRSEKAGKKRPQKRRPTGPRRELSIRLETEGGRLMRRYSFADSRIAPIRSPWPPLRQRLADWEAQGSQALHKTSWGEDLYEALFGPDDSGQRVLQTVFETPRGEPVAPLRDSLRVRIQCIDPLMRRQPWIRTAWRGNLLAQEHWTFELTAPQDGHGDRRMDRFSNFLFRAPCSVLIAAPEGRGAPRLDSQTHFRAVVNRLGHAWETAFEKPQHLTRLDEIEQRLARRNIGIFYYFGRAERQGDRLYLQLEDKEKNVHPVPLDSLPDLWKGSPPTLVFLNLISQEPLLSGDLLAPLAATARTVIAQSGTQARESAQAALNWLRSFLEGGEHADPIEVAHQTLLPSASAWSRYGQWRNRIRTAPPEEELARFTLDRKHQRAQVRHALDEMLRSDLRRLCCTLAYGASGNRVDLFADQVYEYLNRNASEVAKIRREWVELPQGPEFQVADLELSLRRHFNMGPRDSLATALGKASPPRLGKAQPLLLLDWGTRGGQHGPVQFDSIRAWAEFCCHEMLPLAPANLRILCLLSLEFPQELHDAFIEAAGSLRADARFVDRAFRIDVLPPLDRVLRDDLIDYLDSCDYHPPDELYHELPGL
ncbi:MAG: toll/interleukin-1 receptor domain-containing protein, partial [Acidobacteriota bacterium]